MRLFKRKSLKSGYANISEPVSDLDPARISAIKARHSKVKKKEDGKVASGVDDTLITETNTLDTSPSGESMNGVAKPQQTSDSEGSSNQPAGRKTPLDAPESSRSEKRVNSTSLPVNEERTPSTDVKLPPKTPDTFVEGKSRNRKRVSTKTASASQALSQHPATSLGGRGKDYNIIHAPDNMIRRRVNYCGSQSSDCDKTFSPQIVSVNSDITEPSYGISSRRRRQQQSWKKFRKLRKYLHESFNSKNEAENEQKSPVTFFDMIMDAICSYPGSKT